VLGRYDAATGAYLPVGVTGLHGGVVGDAVVYNFRFGDGATALGFAAFNPQPGGVLSITEGTPQKIELLPPDVAGISTGLKQYLADPKCAGFIKELLGLVASESNPLVENGDLLKVFDKVVGQRGVVREFVRGGGEARGSIGGLHGGAQMALSPTRFGDKLPPSMKLAVQLRADRIAGLHETIHFAGLNVYEISSSRQPLPRRRRLQCPTRQG